MGAKQMSILEWTKMEAAGQNQVVIDFVIRSNNGDIKVPIDVQRTVSPSHDLMAGYQALKKLLESCLETVESRLHLYQSNW